MSNLLLILFIIHCNYCKQFKQVQSNYSTKINIIPKKCVIPKFFLTISKPTEFCYGIIFCWEQLVMCSSKSERSDKMGYVLLTYGCIPLRNLALSADSLCQSSLSDALRSAVASGRPVSSRIWVHYSFGGRPRGLVFGKSRWYARAT